MRPCIARQNNALQPLFVTQIEAGQIRSRKLSQILAERAPDFAGEEFVHRRNRARRLVERDALDAVHREKQRRKTDALAVGLVDLASELVEGVEIDLSHGDTRLVDDK